MEEVEKMNTVMVYPNQRTELASYNLYTMEVDKRKNCYSCGGFGHLAQNFRR